MGSPYRPESPGVRMALRVGRRHSHQIRRNSQHREDSSADHWGSRAHRSIAQFGEKVLYQRRKCSSHPRSNMEANFNEGIFLGMRLRSVEIVVGTRRVVVKARSVRRRPESERWDKEVGSNIRGSPQTLVPGRGGYRIPTAATRRRSTQTSARQRIEPLAPLQSRKMYVTGSMLKCYGVKEGCPGCRALDTGRAVTHSDVCRDRLRAELGRSEDGRQRLGRDQLRMDDILAQDASCVGAVRAHPLCSRTGRVHPCVRAPAERDIAPQLGAVASVLNTSHASRTQVGNSPGTPSARRTLPWRRRGRAADRSHPPSIGQ